LISLLGFWLLLGTLSDHEPHNFFWLGEMSEVKSIQQVKLPIVERINASLEGGGAILASLHSSASPEILNILLLTHLLPLISI
jgi:hypothetical protein